MTDDPTDNMDKRAAARADAARSRFLAIGLIRLTGVFILMFGILVTLGRIGGLHGDAAKWLGLAISALGLVQTSVVPLWLARLWASPKDRP